MVTAQSMSPPVGGDTGQNCALMAASVAHPCRSCRPMMGGGEADQPSCTTLSAAWLGRDPFPALLGPDGNAGMALGVAGRAQGLGVTMWRGDPDCLQISHNPGPEFIGACW